MEKAFDFLSRHRDVAFATVEADRPKIRVFQIMSLPKLLLETTVCQSVNNLLKSQ